jgi:hypothetical protein
MYSQGMCLAEDDSDISASPYGIDPAFLPTSKVFNGKLHSEDYYSEKEHTAGMCVCVCMYVYVRGLYYLDKESSLGMYVCVYACV